MKGPIDRRLVIGVLLLLAAGAGVAGWLMVRTGSDGDPAGIAAGSGGQVWTCSMHPQVRLPKPGRCPICSMPLIPTESGSQGRSAAGTGADGMLTLSEHARAMAGVETAVVERRPVTHEIRAVGKVQYNEAGLAVINTRVEGYVERLYVDFTGVRVRKGDHLVEFYSPDLIVAQKELLVALEGAGNDSLIEAAKLKLLRWGLTQEQLAELIKSRRVSERVTLRSPIDGTVTERIAVQQGMVKAGEMLYKLANLESVWVYLDIYESDLGWVQAGQTVAIGTEAYPGRDFPGRIWFINPVLTEESRTVKVLVNIANADQSLKPGMFVSAVIRVPILASGKPAPPPLAGQFTCVMHPQVLAAAAGPCPNCGMALVRLPGGQPAPADRDLQVLVVPVSAVLDSGVRKIVFVERAPGEFKPVAITVGPRAGDFYPVSAGITAGDRVAVRGNFLLDSQLQIQGLPSLFYAEGGSAAKGHQHGAAAPGPATAPGGAAPETPPPSARKAGAHQH